ncbi:MAG: SusD/RagB family nutrient-binding outer membrane lipoprotein [Mariniphaga sp.]|nr:SusD/RagB family nutrient-binding outer membrane lipoprotein [Mariniphaga sp.]
MKFLRNILLTVLAFGIMSSCEDLTELNRNPNAIDAEDGNVNLLLPSVLGPAARNYLSLGFENMAGAMQFIQRTGWSGGTNSFAWDSENWTGYYDILRTNELLIKNASEQGFPFHQGIGLTMRAFLFGQIADYWGDAPYSKALKAFTGEMENMYPPYDSQEDIYKGVIADLKEAAAIFANGNSTGMSANSDLYYRGDIAKWEKFANSLLIRYYVRISEKSGDSKAGVEAIVASGKIITSAADDATMDYTGGPSDQWPLIYTDETSSTRNLACETIIDQLNETNDPRRGVWFAPVSVRWVPDNSISGASDKMLVDGVESDIYPDWIDYQDKSNIFTRLYNPNDVNYKDDEYVGIPPGLSAAVIYNYNGCPNGAQGRFNHHVSMLNRMFMDGRPRAGDMLQARLVSAAEMHFTLAEMALKGWSVGDAESHYRAGIQNSLQPWGVADQFDAFYANVAFDGTAEQVLTQKWVASFGNATEAWNDYKRTGYPLLTLATDEARAPVPALRFGYGGDELNNNTANVTAAIERLEITQYSGSIGKNSVYSRPWILQGTGKPW